jgi:hypothetical protein
VRSWPLLAATLVLLSAPTVEAALNQPEPFEAQHGYMPGLGGSQFIMVSGELVGTMANAGGSFGFFGTTGAQMTGLTRVCWIQTTRQCADSASGALSLVVAPGGSFGLRLPDGIEATVDAEHALAMFVDLAGRGDLNSLDLGRTMLAPMVEGRVALDGIATIAAATTNDPTGNGAGILTALDASTTLEVHDGATVRASLRGKGEPIVFAGSPDLAPIACDMATLPFEGTSASTRFQRASKAAATAGLDIERINGLMDRLYAANEGNPTQAAPIDPSAFGPYQDAAAGLFGGAVLDLPAEGGSGADLGFARFTRLAVDGTVTDGLAWSGKASFEIRDGHVAAAKPLYGFSLLQLPWWSWLLWVLAIAAWGVRLATRVEKTHPTWDRYKWVGWVASPLMFLLVFWLWDLEVRSLLGLSLFAGNASGQVLLLVGLLQVGTFFTASFAAIAPLRMLLRNGSILLRQGTFMGLAGAAASLLGFLFVATYLRSYLDLIVSRVLAGIA